MLRRLRRRVSLASLLLGSRQARLVLAGIHSPQVRLQIGDDVRSSPRADSLRVTLLPASEVSRCSDVRAQEILILRY
jgi:hypothetical protein